MPKLTLQLDQPVVETLQRESRKLRATTEERAVQVLTSYHESDRRFPDGVLREGRRKLIDLLSPIPCLRNFSSSGVDFRFWWVSFELDAASPIAWPVIRALGLYLNTFSAEMMLPTVFKPIPDEWPDKPFRWQIESTAPLLDPADVVSWLVDKLPQPVSSIDAWINQR